MRVIEDMVEKKVEPLKEEVLKLKADLHKTTVALSRKSVKDMIKERGLELNKEEQFPSNISHLLDKINLVHSACEFSSSERDAYLKSQYNYPTKRKSTNLSSVLNESKSEIFIIGKSTSDKEGQSIKLSDFHLKMIHSERSQSLMHYQFQVAESMEKLKRSLKIDASDVDHLVALQTKLSDLATLTANDHETATQALTTILCIAIVTTMAKMKASDWGGKTVKGSSVPLRAFFPKDPDAHHNAQTKNQYLEAIGFTDIIIRRVLLILLFVENKLPLRIMKASCQAVKEKSQLFAQLVALLQRKDNKASCSVGFLTDGIAIMLMVVSRNTNRDGWVVHTTCRSADPQAVVCLLLLACDGPEVVLDFARNANNTKVEIISDNEDLPQIVTVQGVIAQDFEEKSMDDEFEGDVPQPTKASTKKVVFHDSTNKRYKDEKDKDDEDKPNKKPKYLPLSTLSSSNSGFRASQRGQTGLIFNYQQIINRYR